MHKKKPIFKLSLLSLVLVIGLLFSFLQVKLPNYYNYNSFLRSVSLSTDLGGGVYAVYDIENSEEAVYSSNLINSAVNEITKLFKSNGYGEALVVREGDERVRIEVPLNPTKSDETTVRNLLTILGQPAKLRFEVEGAILLTGDDLAGAEMLSLNGNYGLKLTFTSEGKEKFAQATGEDNKGKTMSIIGTVRDKDLDNPLSSFEISDPITDGVAYISGSFTEDSAREQVFQIMSGKTGIELKLDKSTVFEPTLGRHSALILFIAFVVAFAIIMGLAAWLYRGMSIGAAAGLLFQFILILFALNVIPFARLGLGGYCALVLTTAISLICYYTMFEKIKLEHSGGKSVMSSAYSGFKKSLALILELHILLFAISVAVYFAGLIMLKNFAFIMILGLAASALCTALVSFFIQKQLLFITEKASFYGLSELAKNDEGAKA